MRRRGGLVRADGRRAAESDPEDEEGGSEEEEKQKPQLETVDNPTKARPRAASTRTAGGALTR